jgi:hypothetical protein
MEEDEQFTVELANYLLALAGIAIVYLVYRRRRAVAATNYRTWLAGGVQ